MKISENYRERKFILACEDRWTNDDLQTLVTFRSLVCNVEIASLLIIQSRNYMTGSVRRTIINDRPHRDGITDDFSRFMRVCIYVCVYVYLSLSFSLNCLLKFVITTIDKTMAMTIVLLKPRRYLISLCMCIRN